MNRLPRCLFSEITKWLSPTEQCIVSFVCRRWNGFIGDSHYHLHMSELAPILTVSIINWIPRRLRANLVVRENTLEIVKHGNLEILEYLYLYYGSIMECHGIDRVAIRHNHLHILKWFAENNFKKSIPMDIMITNEQMLQWMTEHDYVSTMLFCTCIFGNSKLVKQAYHNIENVVKIVWNLHENISTNTEFVQWAKTNDVMVDVGGYAIQIGNIPLLEWAIKNDFCHTDILVEAIKHGQLKVLAWAYSKNEHQRFPFLGYEVMTCDLEILQWAHTNGKITNKTPMIGCDIFANVETVQWLHSVGYSLSSEICNTLAKLGKVETLQWMHKNGYLMDTTTIQYAATGGNLKTIQWLYTVVKQPSSPTHLCHYATSYGHLDIVKWAVLNHLDTVDNYTCVRAAKYGHLEIVQWHITNGYPWDRQQLYSECTSLQILQWLHKITLNLEHELKKYYISSCYSAGAGFALFIDPGVYTPGSRGRFISHLPIASAVLGPLYVSTTEVPSRLRSNNVG